MIPTFIQNMTFSRMEPVIVKVRVDHQRGQVNNTTSQAEISPVKSFHYSVPTKGKVMCGIRCLVFPSNIVHLYLVSQIILG